MDDIAGLDAALAAQQQPNNNPPPAAEFDLVHVGLDGTSDVLRSGSGAGNESSSFAVGSALLPQGVFLSDGSDPNASLREVYFDLTRTSSAELSASQKIWGREFAESSYSLHAQSSQTSNVCVRPQGLELASVWSWAEQPSAVSEVPLHELPSAASSTSMLRAPGKLEDFGRSSNRPFFPGGLDNNVAATRNKSSAQTNRSALIPPSFGQGLQFQADGSAKVVGAHDEMIDDTDFVLPSTSTHSDDATTSASSVPDRTSDDTNTQPDDGAAPGEADSGETVRPRQRQDSLDDVLDDSSWKHLQDASTTSSSLSKDTAAAAPEGKEWAVIDPMKVDDFYSRVTNPAMTWSFELDKFQKAAVMHLEQGENVFVAAHTSAGKTVVAEYAIALSERHLTRCLYTSPIKALSNQKYRDFKRTFSDVGLLTGDVSINPTASCLILTTEILRSMLYKGADLIRDVEWVIFDEVHYINDAERGVVWEEVIIMLPPHVSLILLSATVPNVAEFAGWIGRTRKRKVYVVSTYTRPVPLEHHIWSGLNGEMHKVCDTKRQWLKEGYKAAATTKKEENLKKAGAASGGRGGGGAKGGAVSGRGGGGGGGGHRGGGNTSTALWYKMMRYLEAKDLMPVVVFSFSKKRCEECAQALSNLDMNTAREKSQVKVFIKESLSRLNPADRTLPQIRVVSDYLDRGIGVHHAGLLPILKEVVEMLFGRGLVKVLFATETFAMGVNMPARAVCFNGVRKHDGVNFRELHPGEYTQMSGRAGRRGLDTVGTVVLVAFDEIPDEPLLRSVLVGSDLKLESKFRLTYQMILNLLRVEDFNVQDMMKRSFSEFSEQSALPAQRKALETAQKQLEVINRRQVDCLFCDEASISDYEGLVHMVKVHNRNITRDLFVPSKNALSFLCINRVVVLHSSRYLYRVALVVEAPSCGTAAADEPRFLALVCTRTADEEPEAETAAQDSSSGGDTVHFRGQHKGLTYEVATVSIGGVAYATKKKAKEFSPLNGLSLRSGQRSRDLEDALDLIASLTAAERLGGTDTNSQASSTERLLDAAASLKDIAGKHADISVAETFQMRASALAALHDSKCHCCPRRSSHYDGMRDRRDLLDLMDKLGQSLSDNNLLLMPEFNMRLAVLRQLNYIDEDNTVQLKGRVACEISSCDAMVLTEVIFDNLLTESTEEEMVAVLSALFCQEKAEAVPTLTENLTKSWERLLEITLRVGNIQASHGMPEPPAEFVKINCRPGMMEVCFAWAQGKPFIDVTKMTDVQEGSIVRCITRLQEVCKEVKNAARVIGDPTLFQKAEAAVNLIKRDIVFAASLYVA